MCKTVFKIFIEIDSSLIHYIPSMVSLSFTPPSFPSIPLFPETFLLDVFFMTKAGLQETAARQDETRYNTARANALLGRWGEETQWEAISPKSRQTNQRAMPALSVRSPPKTPN